MLSSIDHLGGDLPVTGQPRSEFVRCTATAQGDPIVVGTLGVDEGVRCVAEAFAAVPADVLPRRGGQRVGRDHRREHGDDLTSFQPGQVTSDGVRVALDADEDRVPGDRAAIRCDHTLADMTRRGVFADRDTLLLEDCCQSTCEECGVDAGGAGEEYAAVSVVDVDVCLGRLGIEELHVLGSVAVLFVTVVRVRAVWSFRPRIGRCRCDRRGPDGRRCSRVLRTSRTSSMESKSADWNDLTDSTPAQSCRADRAVWVSSVVARSTASAYLALLPGISVESQPPLRPEAP